MLNTAEARVKLQQSEAELQERGSVRFLDFLKAVTIPSASGPQRLRDCIVPFQEKVFVDLAPSLHAIRDGVKPDRRRFWIERTKKASKDGDLAMCLIWLIAYATRPLLIQVVAANQKQAGIIKRRIKDILFYNLWLAKLVRVVQNRIVGKNGAEIIIEATGSAHNAQGETPDLLILNELVHVDRWPVVETHMANAEGVPQGVVIISTNAGFKGTPAEKWRKNAIASQFRWHIHLWKLKAPWLTQEDMDEARKLSPGSEYQRLWKGDWVSGKGDAVTEQQIARCFDNDLQQLIHPEPGWQYVGGLDLGVTNDHSGFVILGVNEMERRMRVAWMRDWAPVTEMPDGSLEVDLIDVEEQVFKQARCFRAESIWYDPHQAKLTAQQLARKGIPMREMSFSSPSNLTAMADSFVQIVSNATLECYDDSEGTLRRDFGKFDIVEKINRGRKLESVADEYGHADVGTALVICLPRALQLLGGVPGATRPDDDVAYGDEEPLTEKEVTEMPDELRELYEMGDEMKREYQRKRR